MDVSFAAFARFQIEFQIGIATGRGASVLESLGGKRRASEIGMEDHACGIDDGPKGKT